MLTLTCVLFRKRDHLSVSDLQNVSITLRILHRPEPSKLPNIYLNIGQDYAERVLPSIINEVLKAVVVRFIDRFVVSLSFAWYY